MAQSGLDVGIPDTVSVFHYIKKNALYFNLLREDTNDFELEV